MPVGCGSEMNKAEEGSCSTEDKGSETKGGSNISQALQKA
jgi:hypothetical protein